ncbi:MAG: hypothetical protein AAFX99_19295, partial [Myxococcota bacterium]
LQTLPHPPEWEIDPMVLTGMSGGYRRSCDGLRLQRESDRDVWVIWVAEQVLASRASTNPPLDWADRQVPAPCTSS